VGVAIVRELYGIVTAENASGCIIVCSGNFTRHAIDFASSKPMELVEGAELIRLIGDVQKQPKVKPASTIPEPSTVPLCPVCKVQWSSEQQGKPGIDSGLAHGSKTVIARDIRLANTAAFLHPDPVGMPRNNSKLVVYLRQI
jgi:restriction system protein